jgi:chromosome segregation ATPase
MDRGENSVIPIPLPTDIPPAPDLSRLPAQVIHTGTVETLIGHNEDLTARLLVNIRRNSILEQQIMEHERINGELMRANSSLTTHMEVLAEKERLWSDKSSAVDSRNDELRARIQAIESENKKIKSALRFRNRVRSWVRPFIDKITSELESERRTRLMREAQLSDTKIRLSEATHQLNGLEARTARDQAKLVEQYESKIQPLQTQVQALKDKAQRFDEVTAKKSELENRIVFLERKCIEVEKSLNAEIRELQEQAAKYRKEAKQLAAEAVGREQELRQANQNLENLRMDHGKLQDQFESLQAVWTDTQKRLESSQLQQDSLNKLNQELSRQLLEHRKSQSPRPGPAGIETGV